MIKAGYGLVFFELHCFLHLLLLISQIVYLRHMTTAMEFHRSAGFCLYYCHYPCCHLVSSTEGTIYVFMVTQTTQLYISAEQNDAAAVHSETNCLMDQWNSNDVLKLKEDKIHILVSTK